MPEIATFDDVEDALRQEPFRVGQRWNLYQNMNTGQYQWANGSLFAETTGLVSMYPERDVISAGFGHSSFGLAPFGS